MLKFSGFVILRTQCIVLQHEVEMAVTPAIAILRLLRYVLASFFSFSLIFAKFFQSPVVVILLSFYQHTTAHAQRVFSTANTALDTDGYNIFSIFDKYSVISRKR